MSRPKQAELSELWRQRVEQQKGSGLPVRAFCREHELGEHSFYLWRRRLRSVGEPVRFALVETVVPTAESHPHRPTPLELILHTGERLRIPPDAATLRLVLSVLGEQGQTGR